MKKRLLLFLLSGMGFALYGQSGAVNLQCYKKFMALGARYQSKGDYTEAIHQYKAAMECDDASTSSRRAAETAIQNAQAAQRNREQALARKATMLIEELRGDQTYQDYLGRGEENLAAGLFQDAIQDFAIARFSKETTEIGAWLDRAHAGYRADSLFGVGEVQAALRYFGKVYVAEEVKSENYVTRAIEECRNILAYEDSIRARGEPIHNYSESFRIIPNAVREFVSMGYFKISSDRLARLPDWLWSLSGLGSLEIYENYNLGELPESLGNLTGLTNLDITGSRVLLKLPDSLCNLTNLAYLRISGNHNLQKLPDSLGNLTNLTSLEISANFELQELPDSLGNLTNLTSLEISANFGLQKLPDSLGNLTNLTSLEISNNDNLQKLPESLGNLTNLTRLEIFNNDNLQKLPESLGNLTNLTRLEIYNNDNLQKLPESLSNLSNLTSLVISDNDNLQKLPDSLGNLTNLANLRISGDANLQELPKLLCNLTSLTSLEISNNDNLQKLPDSLGNLTNLAYLRISGNANLQELPKSLDNLGKLSSLDLDWVPHLWGGLLQRMLSLKEIRVTINADLNGFFEEVQHLPFLSSLIIYPHANVFELPASLGNLTNLTDLYIGTFSYRPGLSKLPPSIGNLTSLQRLIVRDCPAMRFLPESLSSLPNLRELDVSGSGLSKEEIEEWRRRLPQCKVIGE